MSRSPVPEHKKAQGVSDDVSLRLQELMAFTKPGRLSLPDKLPVSFAPDILK